MVQLAKVLGSLTEYNLASQVRFKVARPVAEPEAARITWLGSTQHANKVGELMPHHGVCRAAEWRRRLSLGMFCLPQICGTSAC